MANFIQANAGLDRGMNLVGNLMNHAVNRERNQLARRELDQQERAYADAQREEAAKRTTLSMQGALAEAQAEANAAGRNPGEVSVNEIFAKNQGLFEEATRTLLNPEGVLKEMLPEGARVERMALNPETGKVDVAFKDKNGKPFGGTSVDFADVTGAITTQAMARGYRDAYKLVLQSQGTPDEEKYRQKLAAAEAGLKNQGVNFKSPEEVNAYVTNDGATRDLVATTQKKQQAAVTPSPKVEAPAAPYVPTPAEAPVAKPREMIPGVGSNLWTGKDAAVLSQQPERGIYEDVGLPSAKDAGAAIGGAASAIVDAVTPSPNVSAMRIAGETLKGGTIGNAKAVAAKAGEFADGFSQGFGGTEQPAAGPTPTPKKDSGKPVVSIDDFILAARKHKEDPANNPPPPAPGAGVRVATRDGNGYVPAVKSAVGYERRVSGMPLDVQGDQNAAALYASAMYSIKGTLDATDSKNIAELSSFGELGGSAKAELSMRYRELMSAEVRNAEGIRAQYDNMRTRFGIAKARGYKDEVDRTDQIMRSHAAAEAFKVNPDPTSDEYKRAEAEMISRAYRLYGETGALSSAGYKLDHEGNLDMGAFGPGGVAVTIDAIKAGDKFREDMRNQGTNVLGLFTIGGRKVKLDYALQVLYDIPADRAGEILKDVNSLGDDELSAGLMRKLNRDPELSRGLAMFQDYYAKQKVPFTSDMLLEYIDRYEALNTPK